MGGASLLSLGAGALCCSQDPCPHYQKEAQMHHLKDAIEALPETPLSEVFLGTVEERERREALTEVVRISEELGLYEMDNEKPASARERGEG